jgi:FkbM family methyltransferase
MSFSIKLGNFLFKHAFVLYKPMYALFKNKQDAFEIDLLRTHLHKGDTVLDIGANIGYYATILAELVGEKGHIHCFEPDTRNFEHLQKACGKKNNITLNQRAVGPRTETIKIYTSKNLNVDHRTYEPEDYDAVMDVKAVSIDDYVRSKNIGRVQMIKMDIQGFEMQALAGMTETLRLNPELKMISEFWPYGLRKAGSSLSAYYNRLVELGMHCYLLDNGKLKALNAEQVKQLEPLGEAHYFNIFASRTHVH